MAPALDCSKDKLDLRPLFVYGSLLNDEVFARVLQGAKPSKRVDSAVLKSYKRCRVKGAPYPAAIEAASSSEIVGGLVYLEGAEQLAKLDAFESDFYKRITVDVIITQDKGISSIEADTYIWNLSLDKLDIAQDWSYEKFVSKGKMKESSLYDP